MPFDKYTLEGMAESMRKHHPDWTAEQIAGVLAEFQAASPAQWLAWSRKSRENERIAREEYARRKRDGGNAPKGADPAAIVVRPEALAEREYIPKEPEPEPEKLTAEQKHNRYLRWQASLMRELRKD
jgi:hypothetical protein